MFAALIRPVSIPERELALEVKQWTDSKALPESCRPLGAPPADLSRPASSCAWFAVRLIALAFLMRDQGADAFASAKQIMLADDTGRALWPSSLQTLAEKLVSPQRASTKKEALQILLSERLSGYACLLLKQVMHIAACSSSAHVCLLLADEADGSGCRACTEACHRRGRNRRCEMAWFVAHAESVMSQHLVRRRRQCAALAGDGRDLGRFLRRREPSARSADRRRSPCRVGCHQGGKRGRCCSAVPEHHTRTLAVLQIGNLLSAMLPLRFNTLWKNHLDSFTKNSTKPIGPILADGLTRARTLPANAKAYDNFARWCA